MPDKEDLYDEAIDAYADDKFDEAIALYKQALRSIRSLSTRSTG